MGTPAAMASATIDNDPASENFWVGREVLRNYAGDGARQALSDLRSLIARCPTVTTSDQDAGVYRFAVIPGPQLGDDSVHIRCYTTNSAGVLECNSLIVRIGSDLVAVQEPGNETSGDGELIEMANAALRRYQATGS